MKGQTAIEYLMTYGWAILIILIVAGVLAYYGIFAPAGFLAPTARGFGQIQVLNPWSLVAADGELKLNIENRVGGEIDITGATVTIGGNSYAYGDPGSAPLASGNTTIIDFTTPSPAWTAATSGSSYTATVTLDYDYQSEGFSSTGTISGTYS